MPSIEESKRQVKAALSQSRQQDADHGAILSSLEDEIDKHNRSIKDEGDIDSEHGLPTTTTSKFRFKSSKSDPRERKRVRDISHDRKFRKYRKREEKQHTPHEAAAHPFPREPTNPDATAREDPNAAFRDSLFDALADDEGAAYWESVYSQPIHIYERPTVEAATGELEQMGDEQYAAYVQTRMWERKNPQILLERERKEKQKRKEEEERASQREEYVRRKQQRTYRASNKGTRKFAGLDPELDVSEATQRSNDIQDEYRRAWAKYSAAWDDLKFELLDAREHPENSKKQKSPSQRIPWPVLKHKPVTKPNIEDFIRHASQADGDGDPTRVHLLKTERVKWHPDKMQQRFTGSVDEKTMEMVTGVFHVVDALLENERER